VRRPNSEDPRPGGRPEPDAIAGDPGGTDEFDLIARLRARFEAASPAPAPGDLGIGDDAAAVTVPGAGRVVLAADLVVAGVHVDLGISSPEDVGFKALMVTVSDLAAMGAQVTHALLSVAAPSGFPVERLGAGVAEAASAVGCSVVGGDLSASPVLVVSVTAVGPADDGVPLLRRDGARPGDTLWLTGPVGASAAGLRMLRVDRGPTVPVALASAHRRPLARLREGAAARAAGATAAVDVSDGLLADMDHVAGASGVGVALAIGADAVSPGATRDEALSGGEDYELVVATSDPDALVAAFDGAGLRTPLAIGRCTSDPSQRTVDGAAFGADGWRHRF
jgi:thiamine-monophosphate kinase